MLNLYVLVHALAPAHNIHPTAIVDFDIILECVFAVGVGAHVTCDEFFQYVLMKSTL